MHTRLNKNITSGPPHFSHFFSINTRSLDPLWCTEPEPWGQRSPVSQISPCLQWPVLLGNDMAAEAVKIKTPPVFLMESGHVVIAEAGNSGWHGSTSTPVTPAPPAWPLQAKGAPFTSHTHTVHELRQRLIFNVTLFNASTVTCRLIIIQTQLKYNTGVYLYCDSVGVTSGYYRLYYSFWKLLHLLSNRCK